MPRKVSGHGPDMPLHRNADFFVSMSPEVSGARFLCFYVFGLSISLFLCFGNTRCFISMSLGPGISM